MKRILDQFQDYYFLNQNGTIYNSKTDKIIKADDKTHIFSLKTIEGKYKRITLRTLYKQVYGTRYCIDDIKNLEGQIWKQIDQNSGYFISNLGRVKSYHAYNAKLLKPYKNQNGYLRVDIIQNDKRNCKLVHRLVAMYFLPLPESIEMQLHHIDFDKTNNNVNNLIWLKPVDHRNIHKERNNNVCTKSEENIC